MPNYPSGALQEYALRVDVVGGVGGSGTGPVGPPGPNGATGATGPPWAPVQSATAPATASSGTIATASLTVSRVAPTADIFNVVLQAGTVAGQQLAVLNESSFTITFANSMVSFVSNGTGCTIAAKTHLPIIWDSVQSLWYPLLDGVTSAPSATGLYDIDVYDSGIYDSGTTTGTTAVYGIAIYGTSTYGSDPPSGIYGSGTYGSGTYS